MQKIGDILKLSSEKRQTCLQKQSSKKVESVLKPAVTRVHVQYSNLTDFHQTFEKVCIVYSTLFWRS